MSDTFAILCVNLIIIAVNLIIIVVYAHYINCRKITNVFVLVLKQEGKVVHSLDFLNVSIKGIHMYTIYFC